MKVIINFFINYKLFIVYKETNSHTGTRTRVAWVKTKYPNHLDYMGGRISCTAAIFWVCGW